MPSLLGLGRSQEEKDAKRRQDASLASQSDLAKQLTKAGGDRYALTGPAHAKAINYYTTLLDGDRAKTMQAMQPDIRRINDVYRGADQSMMGRLRGPQRDQALAESSRQRAGQISELTGAPRREAANTLLNEGRAGSDSFMNSLSGGAGINASTAAGYGQQVMTEQERRRQIMNMFGQLGGGVAKLFAPYLMGPAGATGKYGAKAGMLQ